MEEIQQRFIVAEVTKNWDKGTPVTGIDLLSNRFETILNINAKRGYELKSWKMSAIVNNDVLTETIVAVFELNKI